jgi:predicted peptidase
LWLAPLLISAVPTTSALNSVNWFEEGVWSTVRNGQSIDIPYRLHVPDTTTTSPLPLLIWFHGLGECGTDNIGQLRHMDTLFKASQGNPGMIILIPQDPGSAISAGSDNGIPTDFVDAAHEIAEKICGSYPVDRDRIYVSGVSRGGSDCCKYGIRYAKEIAAIAPLAGSADTSGASSLVEMPVWAFHSANDDHYDASGAKAMVNAINQHGGAAFLTITAPNPKWAHDCWTAAFTEYDLLEWLRAQSRNEGAPLWHPEVDLTIKRNVAVWGVWLALVVVIGVLVRAEFRRRSLRGSTASQVAQAD